MKTPLIFAFVGATGFFVDAAILAILTRVVNLDPFSARAISVLIAMSTTYVLNRRFTFGPSTRSVSQEGLRYVLVTFGSAGLNYLVYSAFLLAFADLEPLVALVFGSGTAAIASYLGYSRLVFGR